MTRVILDPKLIAKLAEQFGKTEKYTRETVSKFAHKNGIPSEVALIILAKREGIGTALYQRSLDSTKQGQVREALQEAIVSSNVRNTKAGSKGTHHNTKSSTRKKHSL